MRHSKIIAMILVASLSLMGVGYAYWSEQITINTTVRTGELNVQFVKSHEMIGIFSGTDTTPATHVNLNVNPTILYEIGSNSAPTSTDTITITFGNLYPGTWMRIPAEIKNLGNIPADFKDAEVNFYVKNNDGEEVKLSYNELDNETKSYYNLFQINSLYFRKYLNGNGYPVGDSPYADSVNFSNLESKLETLLADVSLLPQEAIALSSYSSIEPAIKLALPAGVEDKDLCNKTLKFEIKLNFKQFNE